MSLDVGNKKVCSQNIAEEQFRTDRAIRYKIKLVKVSSPSSSNTGSITGPLGRTG